MPLTDEQIAVLKDKLLEHIPSDGTRKGNVSLLQEFQQYAGEGTTEDDYWFIRNRLLEAGLIEKGKGRGGSVRRIVTPGADAEQEGLGADGTAEEERELPLYEPFCQTIRDYFTKDNQIEHFVCEVTALQGRRATGGKWTRPDVTVVAVRIFPFIPGRTLEVITFEIKPLNYFGIDGVFEAAAHSAFAHRCYLAIKVDSQTGDSDELPRVIRECKRFGIGLYTFEDPAEWETFEEVIPAERGSPDPAEASAFISKQIAEESKRKLQDLIR